MKNDIQEILELSGDLQESVDTTPLEAKARLMESVSRFVNDLKNLEIYFRNEPPSPAMDMYRYNPYRMPKNPQTCAELRNSLKEQFEKSLLVIKKYGDEIFKEEGDSVAKPVLQIVKVVSSSGEAKAVDNEK